MSAQYRVVKTPAENLKPFWSGKQSTDLGDTSHENRGVTLRVERTREGEPQILFKRTELLFESLDDLLIHARAKETQIFTANDKILNSNWDATQKRIYILGATKLIAYRNETSILFWGAWLDPKSLWHSIYNVWSTIQNYLVYGEPVSKEKGFNRDQLWGDSDVGMS